jgi:arylsulfatase A-like enzyme
MSDNGTPARLANTMGGKRVTGGLGTMSENGLDVPLIVNCPARVPAGRLSDALTDCSDIFPTLLELAGVPTPQELRIDGHSFAPEALGRRGDWKPRGFIFAQYGTERAVRDQRFKLYNDGRLFDVENDVAESRNLGSSDDAAVAAARRKLRTTLEALPKNADVGFAFRSASAFKKQGKEEK